MSAQTGKQVICRETGKMKNCGTFAEWEEGHSGSAAMCNGGIYDGDSYDVCPSRGECQRAMVRQAEQPDNRYLPVMGNGRTQIVGQTPAARPAQPAGQPGPMQQWRPPYADSYERYMGAPTTIPARTSSGGGLAPARPAQPAAQPGQINYPTSPYPMYVPTPIQPPQQFPQAMQTPFAAPVPFHAGGVTPTFLPEDGEGIFTRLGKNIGQGMIGSFGWQVFDFARNVDMFGRKRK
jgi:hypothetical protein